MAMLSIKEQHSPLYPHTILALTVQNTHMCSAFQFSLQPTVQTVPKPALVSKKAAMSYIRSQKNNTVLQTPHLLIAKPIDQCRFRKQISLSMAILVGCKKARSPARLPL